MGSPNSTDYVWTAIPEGYSPTFWVVPHGSENPDPISELKNVLMSDWLSFAKYRTDDLVFQAFYTTEVYFQSRDQIY